MDMNMTGLRVVVTAGANGIGRATARSFAAEGARVHICDVDLAALEAMSASDPAISQSVCDVSNRAAVDELFVTIAREMGGLDCLVNNAGIAGPTGRVDEISVEDWDRCIAVDLTGQFNCARLAVPMLKRSANASMINLSSQAGKHGFPLRSPYGAAKWGVIGFTKALAAELGEFGHLPRPGRWPTNPKRDRQQSTQPQRLARGDDRKAIQRGIDQTICRPQRYCQADRFSSFHPWQNNIGSRCIGLR